MARELDLRIIGVVDRHVVPTKREQLGESGTSERGNGEQSAIWLLRGGDRLRQLATFKGATPLTA
ncbi:MAG: hypothetical protein ACLPV4_16005 [Solirubrobacteraceae bacterium]